MAITHKTVRDAQVRRKFFLRFTMLGLAICLPAGWLIAREFSYPELRPHLGLYTVARALDLILPDQILAIRNWPLMDWFYTIQEAAPSACAAMDRALFLVVVFPTPFLGLGLGTVFFTLYSKLLGEQQKG